VRKFLRYIFILNLILVFTACNIKRNVPLNQYLLVKSEVLMSKDTEVDISDVEDVLRQTPNHKTLGLRLKLRIYNSVDSLKVVESRRKRIENYREKNKKLSAKEDRINEKRIEKAIKRGDSLYVPKRMKYKDTLNLKPPLKERIKYNWGEPPVIYDSTQRNQSRDQIELFMQRKGYFDATVDSKTELNDKKQEAKIKYFIRPKEKYMVDSIYLNSTNKIINLIYRKFAVESGDMLRTPFRFDSDDLSDFRARLAEYIRNEGVYGFRESYLSFEVDTLSGRENIKIAINISKRTVGTEENEREKPFKLTWVRNVTFHMLDSIAYKGAFKEKELVPRGITLKSFDQIPTFDTLRYDWYKGKNPDKRGATFLFNKRLNVNPELIEFQNYLEENDLYRGIYLPQSYNRMSNLNIFRTIKIETIETENDTLIDVHYYLSPQKKHSFSVEPKGTHNNSFLGVSASLNYTNRNMFRRGYKFKASISGGFESQPEVFGKNEEGTVLNDGTRSFNTFEIGPTLELEMPGLIPIPLHKLSKRQTPSTAISMAYNYQVRPEFDRQIYQFNYLWKFTDINNHQVFTVGIPVIGGIQFVQIDKTEGFEQRLKETNDLFLLNAYSDQAIYKDVGVTYSYINADLKRGNVGLSYRANFDLAGMVMGLITQKQPVNSDGNKEFLGQKYSQFARLDNQVVVNQRINNETSLHYRLQVGAGIPLLHNGPNLPFDYSFFGGGSNDNRGFRARTLGPGIYKYYLDSTSTSTQMGDMRLGASVELRFKLSKIIEGAIFSDVGNIWTYNKDPNRLGGEITKDFYKQLSVSAGIGLRLDFTFFIIRVDMGFPVRNPALPDGSRWIFQSRDNYIQEGIDQWGIDPDTGQYHYLTKLPRPFKPQFHIGIGYPF